MIVLELCLYSYGQFLIHVTIGTLYVESIYLKLNHSVTMVLPMVERLRNWPITKLSRTGNSRRLKFKSDGIIDILGMKTSLPET